MSLPPDDPTPDPGPGGHLLLQIDPADNVAVLTQELPAGASLSVEGGQCWTLGQRLGAGHKIALKAIAAGEKVIKYGAPIGSATRAIGAGEHVHLHNLASDYLPTYTLEEERLYGRG